MKQQILAGLIVGLCVLALYYGNETRKDAFQEWKSKYNMKFEADEDSFRRLIFNRNVETINKHNADETQTYKMGVNQFTGLTEAQFIATYLGSYPSSDVSML